MQEHPFVKLMEKLNSMQNPHSIIHEFDQWFRFAQLRASLCSEIPWTWFHAN